MKATQNKVFVFAIAILAVVVWAVGAQGENLKDADHSESHWGLSHKESARALVEIEIENYKDKGELEPYREHHHGIHFHPDTNEMHYVYIVSATGHVVHHRSAHRVGKISDLLLKQFGGLAGLQEFAAEEGNERWYYYYWENPNNNYKIEKKTSLLIVYDGLLFGSGYYEEPDVNLECIDGDIHLEDGTVFKHGCESLDQ